MFESSDVAILIAVSVNIPGKNCILVVAELFSTLPYNCTELLNCFCSGPTSDKSLGTLFMLSFINTIFAVLPSSPVGKGVAAAADAG